MAGPLLFVYGTLQDARLRAQVLRGAPTRVVGRGSVSGALYDLGEYPGLVAAGDGRVVGLVIELPDDAALALLDVYEGVGEGLYARTRTTVQLDSGGAIELWMYVYLRSVEGLHRIVAR